MAAVVAGGGAARAVRGGSHGRMTTVTDPIGAASTIMETSAPGPPDGS